MVLVVAVVLLVALVAVAMAVVVVVDDFVLLCVIRTGANPGGKGFVFLSFLLLLVLAVDCWLLVVG